MEIVERGANPVGPCQGCCDPADYLSTVHATITASVTIMKSSVVSHSPQH